MGVGDGVERVYIPYKVERQLFKHLRFVTMEIYSRHG